MRDRQRLELGPRAYQDAKALERQRHLAAVLAILRRARAEGADWYTETLRVAVETRARCAPRRGRPVPQTPGAPRVEVLEDGTLKVTARSWLDTERRHAAT